MLNLKIENRPKYKSGPFLIGGPWDRYSGVFGPISNRRLQLRAVGTQFNSDLANYDNFKRRVQLSKESKEALLRRLKLGENIDVVELSENSRAQILAETALLTVHYRVLNSTDRLQRLIFDGDYSMNPPLIDSLKGGKK